MIINVKCLLDNADKLQKQWPKVFCQKIRKIHRKTPVPESLFNKVAAANLMSRYIKNIARCFWYEGTKAEQVQVRHIIK